MSFWLLAIWTSFIAKSLLVIWRSCIAKDSLTIWRLMLLNARWQFGNILFLSSNDRISSFYWVRESEHCFLTRFSNLNRYILFLVFLRNCYLLVSSRLSRLRRNPISHPVFLYHWYSEYHVIHAPPDFWHTWRVFSKQDARGNLVQKLVPAFFPRSAFCQRFLMQTSVGSSWIIPFLLTQNFRTDIFSHDISLC